MAQHYDKDGKPVQVSYDRQGKPVIAAPAADVPRGTSDTWIDTAKKVLNAIPGVPHPDDLHKLAQWIPAVGGAIGGVVGAAGGPVGAVGGAALGGATGQAVTNLVTDDPSKPMGAREALTGMAGQAALQGGAEGAGGLVVKGMRAAGPALMTSALKPAYKTVEKAVKSVELPRVVRTLLDEGVNVTSGGIGKINDLLKATNEEIKDIIAGSKATLFPESVAARGEEVAAKLSNQVAGSGDVAASNAVTDEFMRAHGGAPNLPGTPIPVQRAQELKQGTYRALGQRAYGEAKGATTETEKALARGLKEGIEAAHPEVKGLNARESALIEAKDAISKRVALAANRDPGGIGWIAENPKSFVAFLLSRSPAVKSMLARGLYQSAARASRVPENIIRLGVTALAQSADDQEVQP